MLIDTHLHLIYRDRLNYPWLADIPALNHDSHYRDYARTARQVGIVAALHMEVDVADADRDAETDMIRELMNEPGSLLCGAIASCRPESTDFVKWLDTQRSRSELKGLRRVLHTMPDETSTSTRFRENMRTLSGTGLTFDLCVLPQQIPLAVELVDHCPEVSFVLDHCGVPDVKQGALSLWKEPISELARRENVIGKISGIMAYGDGANWTLDDLRPFVEHMIECFGWRRVVWGSDSPVCTLGGRIETWVAATQALINGCSADEKAALLHKNAMRLWQLSLPPAP